METIRIRGARTHNLKNIDIDLPRGALTVITGLSGSGKSSLAFDTLYAEGQRRYVESLSTYARQFLSMMQKPDVDSIEGLSPAIAIEQKSTSHNPRSTVGTTTEIYDYLRLLFARAGEPRCPEHGSVLAAQTISQMVDQVVAEPEGTRFMLLAPVVQGRKGEHRDILDALAKQGFVRARVDGRLIDLDQPPALALYKKHAIEAVVDRFKVRADLELRLAESFETAIKVSGGVARVAFIDHPARPELVFSARFACPHCAYSIEELEPRLFSFNNPAGACRDCDGLGIGEFFDPAQIVRHPELSLPGGAIPGWDRRNVHYFQLMSDLAAHYGFDLDTPFKDLSEAIQHLILEGGGSEAVAFHDADSEGATRTRRHRFEGVIPNLKRRYRDTESNLVREELRKYISTQACPACGGTRLGTQARSVFVGGLRLPEITAMTVEKAREFCEALRLEGYKGEIAARIVKEIGARLRFLANVGLDYLTLDRSADSLSGGEAQRIRLASQLGAGLVGVMYVLDEPSIGLHPRDNRRLLSTLCHLRDLGNTVIVVEHDADAIWAADHVLDMGPGAGIHGGRVVAAGPAAAVAQHTESLTGQYLSGRRAIALPRVRTPADGRPALYLFGARGNNLKSIDVEFPLGLMIAVTGVSGSGKSTLINDTLYPIAARGLHQAHLEPKPYAEVEGIQWLDKAVDIDQSPIGRTPRSNPATYTGLFAPVRELFSATQEARSRGYMPGRFSFNVKGGRCEACQGEGMIKVEMHFLPDVYVACDLCKGSRYNRETLDVKYKGKNIAEVLEMTVEEARAFFDPVPGIATKLQTLMDVGVSYVKLGQNATTLSGGEAQRLKLSRELSRRDTGATLYILDEPTTGLHFHDIEQLLHVLHRLRDRGNTVVVIEHNLEVIKTADWIIDLGPEGGEGGGRIVAVGTPEMLAADASSYTGMHLAPVLARHAPKESPAICAQRA